MIENIYIYYSYVEVYNVNLNITGPLGVSIGIRTQLYRVYRLIQTLTAFCHMHTKLKEPKLSF